MKRLILFLYMLASSAAADEGAAFLKIGVGAQAAATGGAQTALVRDASAVYWNPAGLAARRGGEFAAHHAELFSDTRYDFMALSRATRIGTLGFGLGYLSQGAIEGRDENRAPTGNFKASDMVAGVALGRSLTPGLRIGAGVKFIQSRIADAQAQTVAADLGVVLQPRSSGFSLGLAVLNVGPGMRFLEQRSSLPLTFAAGVGLRLPFGLLLAFDAKARPYSNSREFSVGTEYEALSALTVRAGYLGQRVAGTSAAKDRGFLPEGFAAGIGLKLSSFNLDYAFTPFGELGNVQRLSVAKHF